MEEEKKRQSTVQSEQIQGFNSHAEDELSLKDLLRFLARKKIFILTITSVFTLCFIFYVQSIIPIYRATVSLLYFKERSQMEINHEELGSFFSTLEQIDSQLALKVAGEIRPKTIFERFLLNIKAYEFKQGVFVKGGFQKKFSRETEIDTNQINSEIYSSTKIVERDGVDYLELQGYKPKVMLEFLTVLVEAAKENVNTEINGIIRSIIKIRINNLSSQIEELHKKITLEKQIEKENKVLQKQIEKENKAKEIVRFSKALAKAKQMGIKDNNFDKPDNGNAPVWFRYGELLLQQKIHWLKSEETPNTKNLSIEKLKLKKIQQETLRLRSKKETPTQKNLKTKNLKLKKLQTIDLPLLKLKVTTIGKHSYSLVKPKQPWVIVGFGVALGLFVSIFIAVLMDLKQFRTKEIRSAFT